MILDASCIGYSILENCGDVSARHCQAALTQIPSTFNERSTGCTYLRDQFLPPIKKEPL